MQADAPEKKPPGVLLAVLTSMVGYPGIGHLLLGRKRLAIVLAVSFTLATLGVLYDNRHLWFEMMQMFGQAQQAADRGELFIPSIPRPVVGLSSLLAGLLWLFSGVHAGILAARVARRQAEPS